MFLLCRLLLIRPEDNRLVLGLHLEIALLHFCLMAHSRLWLVIRWVSLLLALWITVKKKNPEIKNLQHFFKILFYFFTWVLGFSSFGFCGESLYPLSPHVYPIRPYMKWASHTQLIGKRWLNKYPDTWEREGLMKKSFWQEGSVS